jgi:2-polyprenyl-3-methyl-5-hydroxy-6-metoxy-1,4-benzoquinol methylase
MVAHGRTAAPACAEVLTGVFRMEQVTIAVNYLPQVREQYEEFSYPERNPQDEKKRLALASGARLDAVNHYCFKGRQDFGDFRVLVAGGGTGDAAICWAEQLREKENAEVVYLDMSLASTRIAQERAAVRKLENITWINDSLLNLPSLGIGKFDFIDCTGVLHHLRDPDAGLRALKSSLNPAGAMFIMVYAPYGRAAVYMLQNLMRLVNVNEKDPRKKIANAKAVLKSLPPHHWFNSCSLKFNDVANDSGIHDLLLHSQDRAYTILEVHEWLARCGMKMAGEPGGPNEQKQYLPETYVKDKAILDRIKAYPLKKQLAIGESLCGKIFKHSFYAALDGVGETEARLTDTELVISTGIMPFADFRELANAAAQRKDHFTFISNKVLERPMVYVPKGKYVASLLDSIDGERTVAEVLDAVKNSPRHHGARIDDGALWDDLQALFTSLNRGHVAFLRSRAIQPFTSIFKLQERVEQMYR